MGRQHGRIGNDRHGLEMGAEMSGRALERFSFLILEHVAQKHAPAKAGVDTGFAQHALEQFQRKWEPVSRQELRQNKKIERFR